jgi:hypothetical protein
MIYTNKAIILPQTLELLQILQADRRFEHFFLVGGTALALQIGHRLSIDLDLFTMASFDTQRLETTLQKEFEFYTDFVAMNTLKGFVNDVKVDFITHAYPLVRKLVTKQKMRLASIHDIAAMKLNAIAHSGNRQKDFYDIYFLLEHLTLKEMLVAYQKKYTTSNPIVALKGLTYFEDIDFEIEFPILTRKVSFEKVKERLLDASRHTQKRY